MKWPNELCPNCRKPLDRRLVFCVACEVVLENRVKEDAKARKNANIQRSLRQEQSLCNEIDNRLFELVIPRLKACGQVTINELVDILLAEGFYDKYRSGYKDTDGTIRQLPIDLSKAKFIGWVRDRAIRLSKWWAKNEVAFIGTKTEQGHPYLIYLGKKPDAVFDPTMPKKSKAQWSVNKVAQTLEKLKEKPQND